MIARCSTLKVVNQLKVKTATTRPVTYSVICEVTGVMLLKINTVSSIDVAFISM